MTKTESINVHRQRCTVKLDVNNERAKLTLGTPEHRLHIERTQLEPVISILDSAYAFRQVFPELKPRFQEPIRTAALRIARRAMEELVMARIGGGWR